MKLRRIRLAAVLALAIPGLATAAAAAGEVPDYERPAAWACRPGADEACTRDLDAIVVTADGRRVAQPFRRATDPPIDCFYVYPTVSREDRPYSDLAADASVMAVIRQQAGRLASRCRLFVPLYRQATLAHLHDRLAGDPAAESDLPFDDIVAAWDAYLAKDNRGRGVVLVGHSQGAILLQRLIAERIDGQPAQTSLVAAFLAGDPSLAVPPGKDVGGTFAHVPVCTAAAQVGCAYAWGSYRDDDEATRRAFGHARRDGLVSVCANPAAPAGGRGLPEAFVPPVGDGPWEESVGALSAACRADADGAALRVTVEDGPEADPWRQRLRWAERVPRWGLHTLDIALYLGNIVDLIGVEAAAWAGRR